MKSTEYSIELKDLKGLFKKKKCPYCGSTNVTKRVVKEYQGSKRSDLKGFTLNNEDVYKGTIVYTCVKCKKEFLLGALLDEEKLNNPIPSNKINENEKEVQEKENNRMKNYVKKFFLVLYTVMLLTLIQGAVKENQYIVLLIFGPIIIGMYLITLFFTKR